MPKVQSVVKSLRSDSVLLVWNSCMAMSLEAEPEHARSNLAFEFRDNFIFGMLC